MKPPRRAAFKRNLLDLDELVDSIKENAVVVFDWKSPIHLRLIVDGNWTDLWPTTGKWYDFRSKQTGSGVASMGELISSRIDSRPFTLSHVPLPPATFPPRPPRPTFQPDEPLDELPTFRSSNLDDDQPPWSG